MTEKLFAGNGLGSGSLYWMLVEVREAVAWSRGPKNTARCGARAVIAKPEQGCFRMKVGGAE